MIEEQYVPGFALKKIFGESFIGNHCGYTLFGDENRPDAEWSMLAATADIPDQAGLSDQKKGMFWFKFENYQPYGRVVQLAQAVADKLLSQGWKEAAAIDGYPETGSSIDELVDTHSHRFGGAERSFPSEPNVGGYNGARGFKIVCEKPGEKPEFSQHEVNVVDEAMRGFMLQVYGGSLKSMRLGAPSRKRLKE